MFLVISCVTVSSKSTIVIPPNPLALKVNDALTVHDESLPDAEQQNIAASDVSIDCYLHTLEKRFNVKCGRIAESQVWGLPGSAEWAPAKMDRTDLSGREFVFLAVTLQSYHWSLLIYSAEMNIWFVVDSLREPSAPMMKQARAILKGFANFYYMVPEMSSEVEIWPQQCYFQGPGNMNCGIYVCEFATKICERKDFDPNIDILEFRKQMRRVILKAVGGYVDLAPSPAEKQAQAGPSSDPDPLPTAEQELPAQKVQSATGERDKRFYECWR